MSMRASFKKHFSPTLKKTVMPIYFKIIAAFFLRMACASPGDNLPSFEDILMQKSPKSLQITIEGDQFMAMSAMHYCYDLDPVNMKNLVSEGEDGRTIIVLTCEEVNGE